MPKTRPHRSRTSDRMTERPRMTPNVDFGWSRQSPDLDQNYLYDYQKLPIHCYTAYAELLLDHPRSSLFRSQLPTDTDCWCSLAFIQEGPPRGGEGVVYKSQRNKLSVSFSHSGGLPSTSLHWPSRQPPIHIFPCYAMGSYTIAKISTDYWSPMPFQPFFHGLFQAISILNK